MTIRVGYQKSGITPEDHRHYASLAVPPASALATVSGLTTAGGDLASTGAMTATVSAFRAIIQGTSNSLQGAYPFFNDSTASITITDGHATLPRQDLVVAQVRDNPYDSSGAQDGRIYVVVGTANVSPTAPAVPANAIPLWEVRVTAGANAGNGGVVWGSALTDRRTRVGWSQVTTGGWTPYSPSWTASTVNPTAGTGGSLAGEYWRVGKAITVCIRVILGTGFGMGSGIYRWTLPTLMKTTQVGGVLSVFRPSGSDLSGVIMQGGFADRIQAVAPGGVGDWSSSTIPSPAVGDTFTLMATYQEA